MSAISLNNQADPATLLANLRGKAYYLAGFLAEEILDRQPEEIRQFQLRSSILETLTGPLCEAVVNPDAQPGYGAVMLNRLEHAHLFITALDEKHEWFRYHPSFADFLRQIQAEVNPTETRELHQRAAVWLEGNGNLDEANPQAVRRFLEPLVQRLGVSVIVTDDLANFRTVADKLGLEHQVCQFNVRRWVGRTLRELSGAIP